MQQTFKTLPQKQIQQTKVQKMNYFIPFLFDYRTETMDRQLIHSIESVVIDWTHQIRDVLKKDSAQPLLEGLHPTPFVEIEFWKNKSTNLECIYEQVCYLCSSQSFEQESVAWIETHDTRKLTLARNKIYVSCNPIDLKNVNSVQNIM